MGHLIDSDVAIHWRDGDAGIRAQVAALPTLPALSIISCIELENGIYRIAGEEDARRARLDFMLGQLNILPFGSAERAAYANILRSAGPAKRKTNDRMIAATALVHGLTLITVNGRDFSDVPGLKLEIWSGGAT